MSEYVFNSDVSMSNLRIQNLSTEALADLSDNDVVSKAQCLEITSPGMFSNTFIFSGDATTTSWVLPKRMSDVREMLVIVGGVLNYPNGIQGITDGAYELLNANSQSSIVFTEAPPTNSKVTVYYKD